LEIGKYSDDGAAWVMILLYYAYLSEKCDLKQGIHLLQSGVLLIRKIRLSVYLQVWAVCQCGSTPYLDIIELYRHK